MRIIFKYQKFSLRVLLRICLTFVAWHCYKRVAYNKACMCSDVRSFSIASLGLKLQEISVLKKDLIKGTFLYGCDFKVC